MTSWRASLTFDTPLQRLLSQSIPFFADLDRIFPHLCPKDLLYHQDRQKRFDVYMIEQPLKPPAYPLPRDSEGLVNLLAIGAFKNHVTGTATLQFHPKVLCFGQLPQILQELLVLLR